MNRSVIWLIFCKEVTDLLRDRKTLIGAFIIPLVVIPVVFILLTASMSSVERDAKAHVPIVIDAQGEQPLVKQLKLAPGVELVAANEPMAMLKAGKIRAAVKIPTDFTEKLQKGGFSQIELWYDPTNEKSAYARKLIEETINKYETQVVAQRLQAVGLTEKSIHPIELKAESIATDERMTGKLLSGIIPLMLVLSLATGAIPAATDLVSGEKERGTLESLISAPIAARSILTAKLLAVMMMSGISAMASLLSMVILFSYGPMGADDASFTLGFLQPITVLILVVMLLLLAATFAGLELAISTWAKTFKEAQTYMTPVVFAAMVPSYMLMPLNPVDVPLYYYVLPIFNGAAICKEVFFGEVAPLHAILAILSSLVYVTLVIWLAARFFRRESLLVR